MHLYAGRDDRRWHELVPKNVEVLAIDLEKGPGWNLHSPALWSYLTFFGEVRENPGSDWWASMQDDFKVASSSPWFPSVARPR